MFFQMTQIMNIMEDFLLLRGYQYLRLDGSTKADDRTQLLERFNSDPDLFVFILSTRAGGLGLNLQVADTVIIYDSDWNPHQDLQAQDRAHRIGQTKEVRILRLITEKSIEESILARAQEKLDLDGKVIQAGRFDNKSTNEEREMLLRALFESREEGTDSDEEEEMDDDELNEILARNDDELVQFKKIDKERDRESPYGKGKSLPRLIGEDELPAIYQENNELIRKAKAQEEVFLGRGFRERAEVVYTDGLTDDQWVQVSPPYLSMLTLRLLIMKKTWMNWPVLSENASRNVSTTNANVNLASLTSLTPPPPTSHTSKNVVAPQNPSLSNPRPSPPNPSAATKRIRNDNAFKIQKTLLIPPLPSLRKRGGEVVRL